MFFEFTNPTETHNLAIEKIFELETFFFAILMDLCSVGRRIGFREFFAETAELLEECEKRDASFLTTNCERRVFCEMLNEAFCFYSQHDWTYEIAHKRLRPDKDTIVKLCAEHPDFKAYLEEKARKENRYENND